jgi:hypothetical protein
MKNYKSIIDFISNAFKKVFLLKKVRVKAGRISMVENIKKLSKGSKK